MNGLTRFASAGVLSAALVSWGCQSKDTDESRHSAVTTNPVARSADTVGNTVKTSVDGAGGAVDHTSDATGNAAKTSSDVAKTTVEVAEATGQKSNDVTDSAAKTTSDAVSDAVKKTSDTTDDAAKATGDAVQLAADKVEGKSASAEITPSKAPGDDDVKGVVQFSMKGDGVHIHAMISGLEPDSEHGFHIHEKADLSSPDLKSAGGHFNPTHMKHGGPTGEARHGGDLGNLKANAKGEADYEADIMGLSIDGKDNGIIGHSVIIHAKADDLKTDPSGNSGDRIAGGAITADKASAGKKAPLGEKDASNDAKKGADTAK